MVGDNNSGYGMQRPPSGGQSIMPGDYKPYGNTSGNSFLPGENNPNGPAQPAQPQQQQLSREDYRDKWMSSGVKDQAGLTNFLNQYGGTQLSGNGTVKTPYGDDVIDMLIGARSGGNGMPGWTGLPSQRANSVTPWNPNQDQQFSGMSGGNNNNWLAQLLQSFMQQPQPRGQDMPYNGGKTGQGPISNYNWQGGDLNGPGGGYGYGGMTGRMWGQWNPNMQSLTGGASVYDQFPGYKPNPGDMVSNGWGGMKPYDPNSQAVN